MSMSSAARIFTTVQAEANRQLQAELDALRAAKAAADAATEGRGREAADLGTQLSGAQAALAAATARIAELEGVRRKLHNAVLVRWMCRPRLMLSLRRLNMRACSGCNTVVPVGLVADLSSMDSTQRGSGNSHQHNPKLCLEALTAAALFCRS